MAETSLHVIPHGQQETQYHRLPEDTDARKQLLADLPVNEGRLMLGGVSTAILQGGEGRPLVLLHGPGEYAAKWLRVIPDLVTTHQVIAPDLPGHGASQPIDGTLKVDSVIAWLNDLIQQTCHTPPVLVGQILGGAIAARYAIEHGDQLDRLILVDSLGLVRFRPKLKFALALIQFIAHPTGKTHDRFWRRCAFDLDRLRAQMGNKWDSLKAYNLDRARTPSVKAALRGLMGKFGLPAIPPAELARISVPTTLIWGRHDLAIPLPIAQAASARYGWPIHVIDGTADEPPIEQPAAFVEVLRAVLEKRER